MRLRFDEYAADPEVRGPARNATNDALRRVIDYYLYPGLAARLARYGAWISKIAEC